MSSDTVVPNNDSSRGPLYSSLDILRVRNVIVEELEQVVRLFLLVSYNTSDELLTHEQSLLASGWMRSDHWMSVGNRITSHDAATRESILSLLVAGMNSLESMQTLLELWRQPTVGLCLVDETGIAACRRAV